MEPAVERGLVLVLVGCRGLALEARGAVPAHPRLYLGTREDGPAHRVVANRDAIRIGPRRGCGHDVAAKAHPIEPALVASVYAHREVAGDVAVVHLHADLRR